MKHAATRSLAVLTALGALAIAPSGAAARENLLPNASFEVDKDGDGLADGWHPNVHPGAAGRFELDAAQAKVGRTSQRVVHTNASNEWVRLSKTNIPVRPDAVYQVRGWVKATGAWSVLLYEFPKTAGRDDYLSRQVGQGKRTGWVRVSRTVRTSPHARTFKLSLITSGQGEAWFDDFRLESIDAIPRLLAPSLPAAPKIDGRLDDKAWGAAFTIDGLLLLDGKGRSPKVDTTVRVGYRDATLYVGWRCDEPRLDTVLVGDPASWGNDTVELFLMPEEDATGYLHLGLTPAGGKLGEFKQGGVRGAYYVDWYSTRTTAGKTEAKDVTWRAAAVKAKDHWTGEMAVPLGQLVKALQPGRVWRLQLARSRKTPGLEQNSCWSYTPGKFFHAPDRFARVVFPVVSKTPLKVVDARTPPPPSQLRVVPRPQVMQRVADKVAVVQGQVTVGVPDPAKLSAAARTLAGVLESYTGQKPKFVPLADTGARILLGAASADKRLADAWRQNVTAKLAPWQLEEAYALDTAASPVAIAAQGERGQLYGVQTLRQLMAASGSAAWLQAVRIGDWPQIQWRGWHLISPHTSKAVPDAKRVIDVMAALKMNSVAFQIDSRLRYTRDPDLGAENAPTKAELTSLVRHAEGYLMEVIPMTQCWSHFNYFLRKEKYRHLAEVQTPKAGARWKYWNYCPRHPETHKMLFGMIEEQLECFPNARVFHAGLDEITFEPIGVCPRCKGATGGELLAEEVNRLHKFLKSKGLTMGMWGDQLLVEHNGKPPYNTAEALPKIPRDVIIFDWHYSPWKAFPSVKFFKDHGFPVVASGWYEPLNVTTFSRTAHEQGVLGYWGTTWYGIDRIRGQVRLTNAITLAAENAWTPEKPAVDKLGYRPTRVYADLWAGPSRQPAGEFVLLDLSPYFNRSLDDDDRALGWLGLGPKHDLSAMPTGRQWLAGVPFDIPAKGRPQCLVLAQDGDNEREFPERAWQVPMGAKARRLAFLQTCSRPDRFSRHIYDRRHVNPGRIAQYVVHYADGQSETIDLNWNVQLCDWNSQLGSAYGRTGWVGRTRGGALARVEVYEWTNPRPDVPIRSLDIVSRRDKVRPVVLGITAIR